MKHVLRCLSLAIIYLQITISNLIAQPISEKIDSLRSKQFEQGSLILKSSEGIDSFEISERYGSYSIKWANAETDSLLNILNNHGLKSIQYLNDSVSYLYFHPLPKDILYKNGNIRLGIPFFENARISDYHITLATKKVILFISDPHNFVGDINPLRNAITHIVSNNPSIDFYFLNEGFFEQRDQKEVLDSLQNSLSASIPKAYQVNFLAKNYIIDLATECQFLLKDRNIEQYPIDDSLAIRQTLKYEKLYKSVSLSQLTQKYNLENQFITTSFFINQQYNSDYPWLDEATYMERFRKWLSRRGENSMADIIANEIRITRCYLKRDTTMAEQIKKYMSLYTNKVPFAFIGDAHLPGIKKLLPDSIGYLLITANNQEYYYSSLPFDSLRFLDNSRARAFQKFSKDTLFKMKLPVSPFKHEWAFIRKGLLNRSQSFDRIADKFRQHLGKNTADLLLESIGLNDHLIPYKPDFIPTGLEALQEQRPGAFAKITSDKIEFYQDHNYMDNPARMEFLKNINIERYSYSDHAIKYTADTGHTFLAAFSMLENCWYLYDYGSNAVKMELFKSNPNITPQGKNIINISINSFCKN